MRRVNLLPAPFRRWYATPHGRRMTRYAMVSGVAVPVGEIGILIGLKALALTAGWANVFGNSLGAIPSYYLNRSWVWGKGGRSHLLKEILPFWVITIIGVIFGGWFGHLGGEYARHHRITGNTRVVLLLAANLAAFAILWVAKYIFFNRVLFVVQHHHDASPPTHDEQAEAGLAGAAGTPEL